MAWPWGFPQSLGLSSSSWVLGFGLSALRKYCFLSFLYGSEEGGNKHGLKGHFIERMLLLLDLL